MNQTLPPETAAGQPLDSPTQLQIAARRSDLARLQAYLVGAALQRVYPGLALSYQFSATLGDRRPDEALWQMPEKGVFTEDLRADLRAGRCDLVVHSWKDLPIETTVDSLIAATLPRADQRDVLLVRAERWAAARAAGSLTVLTSAPRRAQNLTDFLPLALPFGVTRCTFEPVRGNIPTRLQKLLTGTADGLVVAKAALDRLLTSSQEEFAAARAAVRAALAQCYWMVLPLWWNPTAAAQGALAIEVRRSDAALQAWLQPLNCPTTFAAVEREREILRAHGGGCHQALGVSVCPRPYGTLTFLRGLNAQGGALHEIRLEPAQPWPPPLPAAQLWPPFQEQPERGDRFARLEWFTRKPLAVAPPVGQPPLWIARAAALPLAWTVPPTQLVWASGWETWRKLAARGVWVHGCAEGLGEHETPALATLYGQPVDAAPATVQWVKLTHTASSASPEMLNWPTYELVPHAPAETPEVAALQAAQYFFWRSGSAFRRALELYPALRARTHFCGPGATARALQAAGVTPHICLSHAHWWSLLRLEAQS